MDDNQQNKDSSTTFHFEREDQHSDESTTKPLSLDELREIMAEIRY